LSSRDRRREGKKPIRTGNPIVLPPPYPGYNLGYGHEHVPIGFSQEETEEAILAQRLADMGEFSLNTHRTFGDYSGEQAVQSSSTGMQHSMPSSSGLNSGITSAPYIEELYGSVPSHHHSSIASGMVSDLTVSHDRQQSSSTGMQHSMPSSSGLNAEITTAPYIDELYGTVPIHTHGSATSQMVQISHDRQQKGRDRKEKEPAEVPLSERYPYRRRYQ
jgi:hypothetical protein